MMRPGAARGAFSLYPRLQNRDEASEDDVIVKTNVAIIILGALVLMGNGAYAQHRDYSHGYAQGETPHYQSSGSLYESLSEGHQPYPNPDRELYVNRSCCE
jgi:hypothetical protein